MGLLDLLRRLFGSPPPIYTDRPGLDLDELSRRLDVSVNQLRLTAIRYRAFTIPKRGGGTRTIHAPDAPLKALQRRILHRLLGRLRSHPSAMGFERGRSIVGNAAAHRGQAVLVSMDIRDFFPSTTADRVYGFFRRLGWNDEAATLLRELCTYEGSLPQGAPTSPRLANLANRLMDARLAGVAAHDPINTNPKTLAAVPPTSNAAGVYTRYADDITFSFSSDDRARIAMAIRCTKAILADFGYTLHQKKKLRIRRRHDQQRVTGLVVNDRVNLPRSTRRRLRAIEHRLRTTGSATLTESQLAGWRALQAMIESQRESEHTARR